MIVVSNATPLIYLAKGDLLSILPALYTEVWIPPEIYDDRAALELAEQLEKHFPFLAVGTGNVIDEARQKSIISAAEYQSFLKVFHEAIAWV